MSVPPNPHPVIAHPTLPSSSFTKEYKGNPSSITLPYLYSSFISLHFFSLKCLFHHKQSCFRFTWFKKCFLSIRIKQAVSPLQLLKRCKQPLLLLANLFTCVIMSDSFITVLAQWAMQYICSLSYSLTSTQISASIIWFVNNFLHNLCCIFTGFDRL